VKYALLAIAVVLTIWGLAHDSKIKAATGEGRTI